MKTYSAKPDSVDQGWFVIDATGKVLGRLATEVATRLRGKHKPEYTPHIDTGDYIVVINADHVRVTGNKASDKVYYHHTGYPGGIRQISYAKQVAKDSTFVIKSAVRGMLPKSALGRTMLSKLKVYKGADHVHHAQQPELLEI